MPGAGNAVELIQHVTPMVEPHPGDNRRRARVLKHRLAQCMMRSPTITKRLKGAAITDLHSSSDGIGFLIFHEYLDST